MTQQYRNVRQAMTAIAAVLALSSTPLLAQQANAPPPPAQQTAPATSSPATSAPNTSAPATSAPMVDPGPMPVAEPDPAQAKQPQSGFAELDLEQALPFAGAAALGLLIWGGAAAIRRRRRRKQQIGDREAKRAFIEHTAATHPEALEEEVVRVPRHDPVPAKVFANAPTTDLPEGFDISRFGPHVQAAYRGPSADNPSLSLKHRLRRASFFDQQVRHEKEEATAQRVSAKVPEKGNWDSRQDADFLFARDKTKGEPALQG